MIDLKLLKNNLKDIEKKINSRGESFDLSTIVLDYEKKNSLQIEIEDLRNQKKQVSKEIGELKKNKSNELYFIIGADNLISFHKWKGFEDIMRISKILVFDRDGYKSKALKSPVYKKYHKKRCHYTTSNLVY